MATRGKRTWKTHSNLDEKAGQRIVRCRLRRALSGTLGAVGWLLLGSGSARARDDAELDAELNQLEDEQAPAREPAAAEPELAEAAPPPEAAQPAAAAAAQPGGEIDRVPVTVDRRSKDLQDYSGVASVFSEAKLSAIGDTNARDLASRVPGLQIGAQGGEHGGLHSRRRLGRQHRAGRPGRRAARRRPQGTLRGRNAMGGTVHIVSNRPTIGQFEANAQATFGTFGRRRHRGMVDVLLGKMVTNRAAGFSEAYDSDYENAGPVQQIEAAENADAYAYRLQLACEPSSRFTAPIGYDITKERGTAYLGANLQGPLRAVDDEDPLDVVATPFDPSDDLDDPRRVSYRGDSDTVDLTHQGAGGLLSFGAGSFTVDASGSYRDLEYEQQIGSNAGVAFDDCAFDDVNPGAMGGGCWDSRSPSIIAELRAYASDGARPRRTVGASYFDEDQRVFPGQISDPADFFAGGEFNRPQVEGSSYAAMRTPPST